MAKRTPKSSKMAVAYMRTSSATNAGSDKDSVKRQRAAIMAYATARKIKVIREFYDAAVSGADPIQNRPGFAELLAYLTSNGARVVLVETASRFARDLGVQIAGHDLLKELGIQLIPVDGPDHFTDETPTAIMVRQILGSVAEFEKRGLVQKLRQARDRKRSETGRCEGRKPYAELVPETVALARKLRWKNPHTHKRRSYRTVAAMLAEQGHLNSNGKPYGPSAIKSMAG